jgi:molybdopterin molybdotransferase
VKDSGGTRFEARTADWLSLAEAQARIFSEAIPLQDEVVDVNDALGRALAKGLKATATLPPWHNSAMDGYAVRGDDIAGASPSSAIVLAVADVVRAGEIPGIPVGPGQAVRIMTGAPVPSGADSVVRVEDTDAEQESGVVRVLSDRDRGRNVRPAGEDMQAGDPVLTAGQVVTPGTVAALSTLGLTSIPVVRRPSVAILTTGDELRTPERYDEVRAGAGVPESNGPMLAAAVAQASGLPTPLGIAADDEHDLRARIENGADADVLVTVGGASMGEADLVKRVLDELGFEQSFWRTRIRPGSPFGFGWIPRGTGRRGARKQPVFGLPGNPSSAFVTFELFVRPFLLALSGQQNILRRTMRCVAGEPLRGPADLTCFLRVGIDPGQAPRVTLVGPQGSGLVRTLAVADGLAVIPEGTREVAEGQPVDVMLLDDAPGAEPFRSAVL